ncbi:hypothetical protein MASR2M15_13010 [Anaerolineales bacterium]
MATIDQLEASLQLVLVLILSMLIGLERDRRHQPAGLRTHMLVGFGACLFTIASLHGFNDGDPSRVAAQVVSGVGFLGAGTIMHISSKASPQGEHDIRHLTTAGSIWATAAIGMTVGTGAWLLAICGTLIVWFVLSIVRYFNKDD